MALLATHLSCQFVFIYLFSFAFHSIKRDKWTFVQNRNRFIRNLFELSSFLRDFAVPALRLSAHLMAVQQHLGGTWKSIWSGGGGVVGGAKGINGNSARHETSAFSIFIHFISIIQSFPTVQFHFNAGMKMKFEKKTILKRHKGFIINFTHTHLIASNMIYSMLKIPAVVKSSLRCTQEKPTMRARNAIIT